MQFPKNIFKNIDRWRLRNEIISNVYFIEHFPKEAISEVAQHPEKCFLWAKKLDFKVNEKKARKWLQKHGAWTPMPVEKMEYSEINQNMLFEICQAFAHDNIKEFYLED